MLRAVWFTPTVEQSDVGAEWYRCDVIVVAADDELAPLRGRLGRCARHGRWAATATACAAPGPDDPAFERVICSRRHSWRAIATVDFEPGAYPGVPAVRSEGQHAVRERRSGRRRRRARLRVGLRVADEAAVEAGQTFGRCWAPD